MRAGHGAEADTVYSEVRLDSPFCIESMALGENSPSPMGLWGCLLGYLYRRWPVRSCWRFSAGGQCFIDKLAVSYGAALRPRTTRTAHELRASVVSRHGVDILPQVRLG